MNKDTKLLAAIGSLLLVLSFIPKIGWLTGLVGIILFLISMHQISTQKQDKSLFLEALWGILISVIGSVIGGAIVATAFVSIITFGVGLSILSTLTEISEPPNLLTIGIGVALILVAMWIIIIIYGRKMRKVSLSLEKYFKKDLFKTAATLFSIGGWLSIILVGCILIWVAWILYTVAFFTIPLEEA